MNPDNVFLNHFIKYVNRTFKTNAKVLDDDSEIGSDEDIHVADSNKVNNDKIQLQINQRDSVNTMVKMALAFTPKLYSKFDSEYNIITEPVINSFTGLEIFLTLPEIWSTLVYNHRGDRSIAAFSNTLHRLAQGKEPSLAKIAHKFDTDSEFQNAYIVSLNMAYPERDAVVLSKDDRDNPIVRLATQNRNSFLGKQYRDKVVETVVESVNNKSYSKSAIKSFILAEEHISKYSDLKFCSKIARRITKVLVN